MYSVYALKDPRTDKIHYIGCTLDVHRRFNDHVRNKEGNANKRAWIEELKILGLSPILLILEDELKEPECFIREAHWIQQYAEQGAPLVNAYRANPDRVRNRRSIQTTYVTTSKSEYDYMLKLGRKVVLR